MKKLLAFLLLFTAFVFAEEAEKQSSRGGD